MKKNVLYEDETGYIRGRRLLDGYHWIDEIFLYPEFRAKHYFVELIKHLPNKVKLSASPHRGSIGATLSMDDLTSLYTSLGFEKDRNELRRG